MDCRRAPVVDALEGVEVVGNDIMMWSAMCVNDLV